MQLPTSLIVELHDSGVGLHPCPQSWSLRVSMNGKALSCQGQQDPRRTQWQHCPGEVRTKCITGNQDGPCSRNKAVLGYKEDPPRPLSKSLALDTGTCDAPIPAGLFPGRLTKSEIADWVTGPLKVTSRQQNFRVTMLIHSIIQSE